VAGIERGIADVFDALERWFISTGATQSIMRLAWAVLTVLWLGYVAASTRPGRTPDLIDAFGRLVVAGGLLTAMGSLTRMLIIVFETFRAAGAAVLAGLIEQSWHQFVQVWLVPHLGAVFTLAGLWFAYPWALAVLAVGLLLGVLLFAFGAMVYLAILFFAHLTLLLAIVLAPLAIALLASPATQRWTARWVVVIVRTALVVFTVRVIHAAVLYLAVIVPVREVASSLAGGFQQFGGAPGGGPAGLVTVLLNLALFLLSMLVGTGIGIYAMLRAERLTGQFVDGVAFGEGILGGPLWLRAQLGAWSARHGGGSLEPNVAIGGHGAGSDPWGSSGSSQGGAQEATVIKSGGRLPR
jgi:hypothetical protein